MVRRRASAVSNHESPERFILRDAALRAAPQEEDGVYGSQGCYACFAIRRQCSHAAPIRFSLASGVRNAECADSVTFGNFVSG